MYILLASSVSRWKQRYESAWYWSLFHRNANSN